MGLLLTIVILGIVAFIFGSIFGGNKKTEEKRTIVHHYQDPATGQMRERVEEQFVQSERPKSATEATKSGCGIIAVIIAVLVGLFLLLGILGSIS